MFYNLVVGSALHNIYLDGKAVGEKMGQLRCSLSHFNNWELAVLGILIFCVAFYFGGYYYEKFIRTCRYGWLKYLRHRQYIRRMKANVKLNR